MKTFTIVKSEISKIFTMKPLLFFFALCMGLNALIIISGGIGESYPRFLSGLVKQNGVYLSGFDVSGTDLQGDQYYSEKLRNDMVYAEEFDIKISMSDFAEAYIRNYELDGKAAELMRKKFAAEQKVYDELSQSEQFKTIYCGSESENLHHMLFGTLMKLLLMESFIAATLISIFSMSGEKDSRTDTLIYSSRSGRHVYLHKLGASLICSEIFFTVLCAAALLLIALFTPYAALFGSDIGSCFNYLCDFVAGERPFVTFIGMNVWQYALGCFGVASGLVAAMTLIGFSAMLLLDNSYIAFLLIAGGNLLVFTLVMSLNTSWLFFALTDTPIMLWFQLGAWFTDGGGSQLLPFFETVAMAINLAASAVFTAGALIFRSRRDILC